MVKILSVATTWDIHEIAYFLSGETGFPEANLICEVNEPLDFLCEINSEEKLGLFCRGAETMLEAQLLL